MFPRYPPTEVFRFVGINHAWQRYGLIVRDHDDLDVELRCTRKTRISQGLALNQGEPGCLIHGRSLTFDRSLVRYGFSKGKRELCRLILLQEILVFINQRALLRIPEDEDRIVC
jgi:hypothetical protein